MLLWPHPQNPETQSLPLLHLCASDLCGVTFLWVSDALAVFEKGLPFDDIFKGYSLTFAGLWSFVLLKYSIYPNPQHLIVETSRNSPDRTHNNQGS